MKKGLFFKCQQGASAVEFAIVLPLLLLFVFGIIEFGILLYDKAIITNASREGARTAILFDAPAGTSQCKSLAYVQSVVTSYCSAHLINFSSSTVTAGNVTVSPLTVDATGMKYRTVTVSFGYTFLVFPTILSTFFGGSPAGTIPLNAATTMRIEDQGLTSASTNCS